MGEHRTPSKRSERYCNTEVPTSLSGSEGDARRCPRRPLLRIWNSWVDPQPGLWTFAEAEALEQRLDERFELIDGAIYAMADGSPEHHALVGELLLQLGQQLMRGSNRGRCRPFPSDTKVCVRHPSSNSYRYPDVSVFFGNLDVHPGTRSLFTSPAVLFKVTSARTREVDETTKVDEYRSISSLAGDVLVSQDERRVTIHQRSNDGWTVDVYTTGQVELPGIPAILNIDEL